MEKLNKQRGLRNCNPLNIRRTADLWQGLAVRDIIARWAPPEDGNDTENYARKVCALTGFPPDKSLNPYDPSHMAPLVAAMSRMECGVKPSMSQIKEGWSLYMGTD